MFFKRILCAVLALICVALCFFSLSSCAEENEETVPQKQDILKLELEEIKSYVEIGEYKGLDISVGEQSRDAAVWSAVKKNFATKKLPQRQVEYYKYQLNAEYSYYAQLDGKTESEIEAMLESSVDDILAEAKELTKSDLVYAAIVKLEGISVSESQKESLFDKYVEKYVSVYGYTAEYVKENMADAIYSSMLYDKTTEFLLNNNNVK